MDTKVSVSSFNTENAHSQKLLGVTNDRRLNFHVMFPIDIKKRVQK